MANEDETVPNFKPDVPASSSSAIVKSPDQAKALARKIAGEELPGECRFHCVTCGWNKTLKFEDDEIAALGGDITAYGGPCPDCESMTLTPHAGLMGDDVKTIYERAKKNRREEYAEQADVLVDRVKQEIGSVMGGSTLDPTPEEEHDPDNVHDPRPPGQRDDLPDADDVDSSGLDPRSE